MNIKYRTHNAIRNSNIDNLALGLLNPILKNFGYIPFTGSALRPSSIVTILNDIIINERRNIIEFGSGISTLVIAKIIEQEELDINFYSVEEDQVWMNLIKAKLEKHQISNNVKQIYSPIVPANDSSWHDTSFIETIDEIDCIVVDGPKAFSKETSNIRTHALDAIKNKLSNSYSIFLDDCHRANESKILNDWSDQLGLKNNLYYQHLGVIFCGHHFNVCL